MVALDQDRPLGLHFRPTPEPLAEPLAKLLELLLAPTFDPLDQRDHATSTHLCIAAKRKLSTPGEIPARSGRRLIHLRLHMFRRSGELDPLERSEGVVAKAAGLSIKLYLIAFSILF